MSNKAGVLMETGIAFCSQEAGFVHDFVFVYLLGGGVVGFFFLYFFVESVLRFSFLSYAFVCLCSVSCSQCSSCLWVVHFLIASLNNQGKRKRRERASVV